MKIVRRRRGRRCHRRRRSRASNPLLSRHVSRPHLKYAHFEIQHQSVVRSFVLKRKRSRKKFVFRFLQRDIFRVFLNVLVAGNDTRKWKYTISTHLRRRKREETTRALFLSLSLSLFLYIRLRLSLTKRTRMATTFFSSKLRWYQQLVFNLVQRVF